MIEIRPFKPEDRAAVVDFVATMQEHERSRVAGLKPGSEMAPTYADAMLRNATAHNGTVLIATLDGGAIGFV